MTRPLAIVLALALVGCASTVKHTEPGGAVTEIRAGFGNKITRAPVTVEPADSVVSAGERLGGQVVAKASEAFLSRVVDSATSAAVVR